MFLIIIWWKEKAWSCSVVVIKVVVEIVYISKIFGVFAFPQSVRGCSTIGLFHFNICIPQYRQPACVLKVHTPKNVLYVPSPEEFQPGFRAVPCRIARFSSCTWMNFMVFGLYPGEFQGLGLYPEECQLVSFETIKSFSFYRDFTGRWF